MCDNASDGTVTVLPLDNLLCWPLACFVNNAVGMCFAEVLDDCIILDMRICFFLALPLLNHLTALLVCLFDKQFFLLQQCDMAKDNAREAGHMAVVALLER
jgi:hypothetical protein